MTCDVPVRMCLWDHIRPHLDGWTESPTQHGQYSARCPVRDHGKDANGDHKRSLSLTAGTKGGRIVCYCHGGCDQAEVRTEMMRRGVLDGCLPRVKGQRTEDELLSTLTAIMENEPPGTLRELHLAAVLWNGGVLPRGKKLVELATRARICRSTAYDAVKRETDKSGSRTFYMSGSRTSNPDSGLACNASTSRLDNNSVTGVENWVVAPTPQEPVRLCEWCSGPIPSDRRVDARFCSPDCRLASHRAGESNQSEPVPDPKPVPASPRSRISPETKQKVIRLHVEDGYSPLQAGRAADISERTAIQILERAGVRTRMKGGRKRGNPLRVVG